MIPNPDYDYPECWAEYSRADKMKKAAELFVVQGVRAVECCQGDFRIASLVAYRAAAEYFKDAAHEDAYPEVMWHIDPLYLPVRYCGGDMAFGRVFAINHCAFTSPDSIIGFRNAEYSRPQEYFKILKGLKYVGTLRNWVLFKLDRDSTDDMTGTLYSPLEKNFTIEFAHFPHDADRRILYRWEDC
ncbi:hypothetical protein [uncultured Alistipes sp.]|uniref:hypothetical protein n=1 Tax=uncultured Alistipes sp. TaxID=538949 RepID=UPI00263B2638|nr:hypothetical protein [uncultured Alistipes sp.]